MYREMRSFPEVDRFLEVHGVAPRFRRPILAIIGGTNLGKSMLAASILKTICAKLGKTEFLEVTVETDDVLDLSELDVRKHGGALLDGIGDPLILKRQREVLQGRPKVTWGGRSATMRFAYPYTLCRRAVIATCDLSASGLQSFKTDHWLRDERNVIQLWLQAPAWIETSGTASIPAPPALCPREQMQSWCVAELCDFLERADLHGPAQVCRQNGVAGADLLELTEEGLQTDLRFTPFAARKIVRVRAAFLM